MNKIMGNALKMGIAGLALMANGAMANPVLSPTQVSIDDYSGSTNAKYWKNNGSYAGRGGAWSMPVYDQNGDIMDTLLAFCLEVTETITLSTGSIRYNISIDNYAANGGRGGQTQQEPNRDYLSEESAWLYFQAAKKDGNGSHDGDYGDAAVWGDVQHAIWMLENEIDGDAHLQYILNKQYADSSAHYTSITSMISAAQDAVNSGWSNNGEIVVYNLWEGDVGTGPRQSMIAFEVPPTGGQDPVPEPATLLLLGGGLLGFAGMRRRRRTS